MNLQKQTIVVTGGARRLGRAIAFACAGAGANVVITFNTSESAARQTLEDLRAAFPGSRFDALQADLSQSGQVAQLADKVRLNFDPIFGLVNNAAIFRRTPFETLSERDFDDHIAANLKAPFLLCKAFGDIFLANGRGAIVNIADIHGLRPLKNYVPYCVSKAGLIMLTQAMAKALAPGVRVNCICPGTILLPSEAQGEPPNDEDYGDDEDSLIARVPLKRLGTAEEIAATVMFLLAGPQFVSGAVLPVDGAEHLR